MDEKEKQNQVSQDVLHKALSVKNKWPRFRLGELLVKEALITVQQLEEALTIQEADDSRRLGEILIDMGATTEEAIHTALAQKMGMPLWPKIRLGEFLVKEGLISSGQLEKALLLQKDDRSQRLGDILIEIGATTEEAVYSALAQKMGVPFVRLKHLDIKTDILNMVPAEIVKKHAAVPIMMIENSLVVAVSDPTMTESTQDISFTSNRMVELVVAAPSDIIWAINEYYESDDDELDMGLDVSPIYEPSDFDEDTEKLANDWPIVKLVQKLLIEAINRDASDIHIKPNSKNIELLFRIHGKLTHIRNYRKRKLPHIVARIKVIARMDLAQHRLPQDGRFQVRIDGETKEMRISVIPTVKGESVVIRILASAASLKPLDHLGLNKLDTDSFDELLRRDAGLILVTGPTGSGKSTTLYSALNILREMNLNIVTVEDPVEIHLDGIEQVQINHELGMDFGRVLRNILRHDPDVIMVGEIRDEETARIAVQSAHTGHLVLSTLHTGSAADTIIRLGDMYVEPYMIASGLLFVITQRLVKLNCSYCKVEEEISHRIKSALGAKQNEKFYVGEGCTRCGGTGISGRVLVYEFMRITQVLQEAILGGASTAEVNRLAVKGGMQPIFECAMTYARQGDISLLEVYRTLAGKGFC